MSTIKSTETNLRADPAKAYEIDNLKAS